MDMYTHVARSFFFERPHLSLALLTIQAHIWAPFKVVHVLGFKLLPPVAVTTGTATIGRGVAAREALLLAACAHWLRPCLKHHINSI